MQGLIEFDSNKVTISGEIDIWNCQLLYDAFEKILLDCGSDLTIDIRDLRYLDSAGINALFWLADQLEEKSRQIKLIVLQSPVSRLLDLVGIKQLGNIRIVASE